MKRRVCAVLLLCLVAGCGGQSAGTRAGQPPPIVLAKPSPTPPVITVTEPTTAAELGVALDPQGRPYDARLDAGVSTQTRPFGTLDIQGGQLRVMDGNTLEVFPGDERDAEAVDFAGTDQLHVDIVWEVKEGYQGPLGVRVEVPGSQPVAQWSRFRDAYGTDGGVGGITSEAVVQRAEAAGYRGWPELDLDYEQDLQMLDLDGRPGDDSLIFNNGFGDGGFPMSEGRDAAGNLVAVLIWDTRYPWRLAVPEGAPPPDIGEREQQLADCMAGRRPIQVYGKDKSCT